MIKQFHSWVYIWEKKENTNSKRYLHPNIHSITIGNSQDMEANKVSIKRRIDRASGSNSRPCQMVYGAARLLHARSL